MIKQIQIFYFKKKQLNTLNSWVVTLLNSFISEGKRQNAEN